MALAFAAFINDVTPPGPDPAANAEAIVVAVTRSPFTPMAAGLLGIFAMGHEFRYRTIVTTLLVVPHRTQVLVAKALTVTGVSAAMAVLSLGCGLLVCLLMIDTSAAGIHSWSVARGFLGFVGLVVGWGVVGLGITALIRSQMAAIVVLIGYATVVEPLLKSILTMSKVEMLLQLSNYLPFTAASAMIASDGGTLSSSIGETVPPLAPGAGACVFASFVLLLLLIAIRRFGRQSL
jgi:ABC-2 type transport system permease protein